MKRCITMMMVIFLLATMLTGCRPADSNGKLSVVCTMFPQYDWVCQILGDNRDEMEVTFLLNNKIDLHTYQPSVDDFVKISSCDLFIYGGGESDAWVEDALKDAANPKRVVINLLEVLGGTAKTEEITEEMEEAHEEGAGHEHAVHEHEDEEDDYEREYDEHVWLSLKNAQVFCSAVADALSSLNAAHADAYQHNLAEYLEKLSALDSIYQKTVEDAPVKTLLFGDRFPFRYMVDDYGLTYYAAFPGCSAETEASFDTVIRLALKMDELDLKTIMITESSDRSLAETIRDNTQGKDQSILVLDAMQSVTSRDVENGMSYLAVMENNLNVLKEALR